MTRSVDRDRGASPPAPVREDGVVDEDLDTSATDSGTATDRSDGDRPQRGGSPFGLIALLVVTMLLLAAAITAGVFWANGSAEASARENALSAARQTAVNLTSIDFGHAEEDVRRVLDGSTGDFGGLFTQNLDSYVGVVKEGEVVTAGEVTEAGIEKFDGDTASAVVAVKTTVKNKTVPQGEQRFYRLVEQLEHQDGRWLVSRVEFVP
ncbi:hypothetical protein [Pseudonocardia xishanensis]